MSRAPARAPAEALDRALAEAFPEPPAALGAAVSGGGDSLALLLLLADWARARAVRLEAATVDHGLRAAAAAEAATVAGHCARLGIAHEVLIWSEPARRGNLMDAARRARQALLADWAGRRGLAAVALGHTRDDQAETVLMRLARGAGVDGLSAMAPLRRVAGVVWVRPLLDVARASLRTELARRGLGWAEDPTNAEPRFLRVRTRRALAALAPLGIDAAGLAATARRLAAARRALAEGTRLAAASLARVEGGDVVIDAAGFAALPEEIRARLLGGSLAWIGAAEHPPRRGALDRLMARLAEGRGGTLHGVRATATGGTLRLSREPRAVRHLTAVPGACWDGRWRLEPPPGAVTEGLRIAALGADGLRACPSWRATGVPRTSLIASPAVWQGPWLVAAPLAGLADGWTARTLPAATDFPGLFILH